MFFVEADETIGTERERYYVDDFVPAFDGDGPEDAAGTTTTPVKPTPANRATRCRGSRIVNPNFSNVITDNDAFVFDGKTFDAAGRCPVAPIRGGTS